MNDSPEYENQPSLPPNIVGLALVFEGSLAGLAWLLGWLFGVNPLQGFRWDWWAVLIGLAATLPMLALFYLCIRLPVGPLARIKHIADEFMRPLFASCSMLELLAISVTAGIGEEMLFRGFLQQALALRFGIWAALAAASVIFGLMHLITPTYAVLAALLGAYLGEVWIATGNILSVIIAHALYDFLALCYLVRTAPPAAH